MGSFSYQIMLLTIFIFSLFGLSPQTEAFVCKQKEVHMEKNGGSMSRIPQFSQGTLPVCFALTASIMIDAYRFSHKPPKGDKNYDAFSSPIAAAVETSSQNWFDVSINGGDIFPVFDRLKKIGSCDRRRVESVFSKGNPLEVLNAMKPFMDARTIREITEDLKWRIAEAKKKQKENPKKNEKPKPITASSVLKSEIESNPDIDQNLQACEECKKNPSSPETIAISELSLVIREYLSQGNALWKLEDAIKKTCKKEDRIKVPDFKTNTKKLGFSTSRDDLLKEIETAMDKPIPQPIEVGLCHNILYQGKDYRGVFGSAVVPIHKFDCNYHSALIVGRRIKDGKCQYHLRDSWGSSCCSYRDWECKNGHLWVDADALKENIDEVTYLE